MNFLDAVLVGRLTVAAGIMAAVQISLLILMFAVATNPFGPMSDVAYAITPVLMLPLLLAFRQIHKVEFPGGSQWVLVLGILGIAVASINQIIFLLKVIDLKQSMFGYSAGIGLIGLAILLFSLFNRTLPEISGGFSIFSIVLGAAMTLGLVLGVFFLDEVYAMANGTLRFSPMTPITFLIGLSGAVNQLGLPVWLFMLGRMFLAGKITIPA